MKNKKKNSIKVSKDSNQTERARPINDPSDCKFPLGPDNTPCPYKEKPWGSSICSAIVSIRKNYSKYCGQISTLSNLIDQGTDKDKKGPLQLLVNVFFDFLTTYTNCSSTLKFQDFSDNPNASICKDFCTSLNVGKCNPSCSVYTNIQCSGTDCFSLADLSKNMNTMLFNQKIQPGAAFYNALNALGTNGTPAANPFDGLFFGMSGVHPKTDKPIFNFETNFDKIYANIKLLIPSD